MHENPNPRMSFPRKWVSMMGKWGCHGGRSMAIPMIDLIKRWRLPHHSDVIGAPRNDSLQTRKEKK